MSLLNCMAILFVLIPWCGVEGCYNKQRVTFCPRKRVVFENLCPGVNATKCNYVELKCGCVSSTSRRKDGKCVASNQCEIETPVKDAGPKEDTKVIQETPVKTPGEVVLPTPDIKKPPVLDGPLYYIEGRNGCPEDTEKCAEACNARGFLSGACDAVMNEHCFCRGRQSSQQPQTTVWHDSRYRLAYPYGRFVANNFIIEDLKGSYGCPDEAKCFSQCRQRGVQGAFCSLSGNCFCEAFLPTHIWENSQEFKDTVDETGVTQCETAEICKSYCQSKRYSSGICLTDESRLCYCYDMFAYNLDFTKLLQKHAQDPQGKNSREHVIQLLQNRDRLVLVQVSREAWGPDKCHCMDSTYTLQTSQDTIQRTVSCHVPSRTTSENITFKVNTYASRTTIELTGGSRPFPLGLESRYVVLTATATCSVVQLSETSRGARLCAIWGVEKANGKIEAEEECFTTMKKLCMEPVIILHTHSDYCGRP